MDRLTDSYPKVVQSSVQDVELPSLSAPKLMKKEPVSLLEYWRLLNSGNPADYEGKFPEQKKERALPHRGNGRDATCPLIQPVFRTSNKYSSPLSKGAIPPFSKEVLPPISSRANSAASLRGRTSVVSGGKKTVTFSLNPVAK